MTNPHSTASTFAGHPIHPDAHPLAHRVFRLTFLAELAFWRTGDEVLGYRRDVALGGRVSDGRLAGLWVSSMYWEKPHPRP